MGEENKNYYMEQEIGGSDVAPVWNPAYLTEEYKPFETKPRNRNVGQYFTNDSKYDEYLGDIPTSINEGLTIGDLRARKQSGWDMAGNALVNNLVIAGTTAVGGVIGLVDGIFEFVGSGEIDRLWNNTVNNKLTEWQESAREAFPIYRGNEYQNKSLIGKMGSGIFWADLFQNLGYTEGMLIPGAGVSRLLSGAPKFLSRVIPSLVSSIGEASIEAVSNRNEEVEYKKAIANQRYNELASIGYDLGELNNQYMQDLQNIEDDATKAGNFIFASNIALLTMSNNIQFGNLFSRGFGTAKRLKGALKRTGDAFSADNAAWYLAKTGGKKVLDAFSEGTEEVMQSIISSTPQNYTDYNTFNESIFNPEKRELTANLWSAFGKSYSDTMQDSNTAVDFMSGFLIGAIGVPMLKKGGFPLTLENNAFIEMREAYNQASEAQELATQINTRLQNSKEINSYYNGLVRHMAIQDDMNRALDSDDTYNYKTAESAQFISDVMMFDDAGDLNYLKELIGNSVDLSDEGISSIIQETSKDGEGPFMQNDNAMDIESVRTILQQRIESLQSKVDTYSQDKQSFEENYPNMDKEALENGLFLKQQFRDHISRYDQLSDEIYEGINSLLEPSPQLSSQYRFSTKEDMIETLASNPSFRATVDALLNDDSPSIPFDEKQSLVNKIEDLNKISKGLESINKSLKDIIANPKKSKRERNNAAKKRVEEEATRVRNDIKSRLSQATTLSEFRKTFNDDQHTILRDEAVEELNNEGSSLARNYKETKDYNIKLREVLNSSQEEQAIKEDALKIWQNQYERSNNLNELANPNSPYLNDEDATYDETLTPEQNTLKFQEAQYALLKALNQVNNDEKFRDKFSRNYRVLREKGSPNPTAPVSDVTGSSETTTIPPVSPTSSIALSQNSSVGNITSSEVRDENKSLNDKVETTQSIDREYQGKRPYYRPSIPEIHIEASKEGDFRPFNIVAPERQQGVNFDALYNYLRDNNAFNYVNEGNLRVEDEVGFMIDPSFNDNTIFLIDTKNNQVIGSLDESEYSVNRYEGLQALEERIRKEFRELGDKTKRFIATPTTRVSKIMIGKIPYSTEERSLADIPNVSAPGRPAIFGIVRNGTLSTNNKLDDSLVIKPVDMSNKEGRLYLLIPNAAGKYSPAAIRVKHFNKKEFDPEDVQVQNTPIFKSISKAINMLASSNNEVDVTEAMNELRKYLYIDTNGDTRTIHIDWFSSENGSGIRFTKTYRNARGEEVHENINGKRVRKQDTTYVVLNDPNFIGSIFTTDDIREGQPAVDTNVASQQILEALLNLDLPIQVNIGMINSGGYNNMLINSNVLTSNISDARVISSWFTTDYFDVEGNLHASISPASVSPGVTRKIQNPVGGLDSSIPGTKIIVGGITYYADLTRGVIYDSNGQEIHPENAELINDLAWTSNNFGEASNGSMIWDNKVLLPSGKVLNRETQKYLTGKEAEEVKSKIAVREDAVADTKKVIASIAENQRKVDKDRTDSDYYYILEDDGEYHAYDRVHKRLGDNWIISKKQLDTLKEVRTKLAQLVDDPNKFNNYLANLGNHYKIDLTLYNNRTDVKSRNEIATIIQDSMSGTNSKRALDAGGMIDSTVRKFFTSNETPIRPSNMNSQAFSELIDSLTEIRSNMEVRGERFLTNNIVLFQKYEDGTRVAGEVDILSVDSDGNFRIYDVKTSKYSFHDFTNKYGERINYFRTKAPSQRMSNYDYYTLQLSAYKNLFESQYHTPITTLAILPFKLDYSSDNSIRGVTKEKGIIIKYNPAVNVPLVGAVRANTSTEVDSSLPIFNSTNETQEPINNVLPEYNLEGSKVGYFVHDGKLYRGYLTPIGKINGVDIYMTKIPNFTKGFNEEAPHVASNSYLVVFPNGNSFTLIENDPLTMSEQQAKDTIEKVLSKNPQRVQDMADEKTIMSNLEVDTPRSAEANIQDTPATIISAPSSITGARKTIQAEQAITEEDDELEPDLDLTKFREVDTDRPSWDREKELSWLDKVLPQLSKEDRVKIFSGLIKVGESGAVAWGQFNNGIITLSDIAAEGTTYHEAFHVVFDLLLDQSERQALYDEARRMYGDKDNLSLEEAMAEGFREYVMTRQEGGLLNKIRSFFKDLWIKVSNWKKLQPHLIAYYQMINEGKYAEVDYRVSPISLRKSVESSFDTLDNEIREALLNKGWTSEKFDSISQEERDQAIRCYSF